MIATLKIEPLSLEHISKLDGAKYNASKFPAVFLKLSKGSCNIFRTGTITFLGYKCISDVEDNIEELISVLGNSYVPRQNTNGPQIRNIVYSFKVNEQIRVDLDALKRYFNLKNPGVAVYEPDIWNALHLMLSKSIKAIVHYTGSGIIAGLVSEDEVVTAIEEIMEGMTDILLKH